MSFLFLFCFFFCVVFLVGGGGGGGRAVCWSWLAEVMLILVACVRFWVLPLKIFFWGGRGGYEVDMSRSGADLFLDFEGCIMTAVISDLLVVNYVETQYYFLLTLMFGTSCKVICYLRKTSIVCCKRSWGMPGLV